MSCRCLLFTGFMSGRKIYSFGALAVLGFFTWFLTEPIEQKGDFPEIVKISLRDVGNQLLLSNHDSTSLILPVVELGDTKFELSFQHQLTFEPGMLVSIVNSAFQKSGLPENYIVEVIQCTDHEVAYSYRKTTNQQTTIIPCVGRFLPLNCYTIEVNFTDMNSGFNKQSLLYIPGAFLIILLGFQLGRRKRVAKMGEGSVINGAKKSGEFAVIGSFQFYPEQNKLVKSAVEIGLSRKECELLAIFVTNPNQIIKRDELTKRVWEDKGVIVGRSLDTYISKLRKKLQSDDAIKLTNVHGVGYKLELNT